MTVGDVSDSELQSLVRQTVDSLRATPYGDLCRYLKAYHLRLAGATGASYDVEVQAVWDDPRRRGGDLPVMVSGWESGQQGLGTTEDFIIAPDGTFVGE